ncbi:MAG: hypothetical protein M3004_10115 [Bacteroidota bacterium]|nr:hypothetical protein [Bacteroidota bacterium]
MALPIFEKPGKEKNAIPKIDDQRDITLFLMIVSCILALFAILYILL